MDQNLNGRLIFEKDTKQVNEDIKVFSINFLRKTAYGKIQTSTYQSSLKMNRNGTDSKKISIVHIMKDLYPKYIKISCNSVRQTIQLSLEKAIYFESFHSLNSIII
jgi:hypothetical protein